MKILSHTGNMVKARVGMHVTDPLWVAVANIELVGSKKIRLLDFENESTFIISDPKAVIMISCPFEIGDKIECRLPSDDFWFEDGTWQNCEYDIQCLKEGRLRHFNPDLRTSPDYERSCK